MTEKWNSGVGGYICDNCRALLWAGHNGSEDVRNRRYIYSVTPTTVVEFAEWPDGYIAFCSNLCVREFMQDPNAWPYGDT